MYAQMLRTERLGEPRDAFQLELVPTPVPGPGEVLVAVMAAGINFNNVWAARGIPINVITDRQRAGEPHDFHIGGSDASGIVWALGAGVRGPRVGDHVVIHPGWWEPTDPHVLAGGDPMLASSARIWGYNTNFGSFAQFCLAQSHQLLPKAEHLSWAEAAAPTLVGTTAYRMLHGWPGNTVGPDDVVLVWGGSGGVGSQAIQLARAAGALPVAVVSDPERGSYCEKLGAVGWINRNDFGHWGIPPHWTDTVAHKAWTASARAFGKQIWDIVGRRNPNIVIEHPGEDTVPTSVFVCEPGGMVVICAGTTGYSATVDLRHHWVRQKRLQGSHGTNDAQAIGYNALVRAGAIDPCVGEVRAFTEVGRAHQDMSEGRLRHGNTVILVGAGSASAGHA
jgi:crotonyl-CoA carboxylase/reductase